MDGSKCNNKNGICYQSECINSDLVSQFTEYATHNTYTESALVLQKLCPYGASQEKNSKTLSHRYDFNSCQDQVELCNDQRNRWFNEVCCETCLKYNLKNEVGLNVTCENLGSNPCYNGGLCKTLVSRKSASFNCQCPRGFRGKNLVSFKFFILIFKITTKKN